MPLVRIEVCDFKSYRGHQIIGPFRNFTSIIGPNGAGKSNLMDAISFVLGVKSAQLRSSQLKDLVYRGRRLAKGSQDPSQMDDEEEEEEGEGTATKAWVLAVYEDHEGKEWSFQRTISLTGSSEYKLNGKVITYTAYNAALVKHNILVKAKNFLVFQGDVEAVASQSPRDLARLVEQISGSLELAQEYDKAKEAQERATENAMHNLNKKRGMQGELKQYNQQKEEADKFERLVQERDEAILHRMLWKLWHIEEGLERNAREIKSKNKALETLRADRDARDEDLSAARAEQAKTRSSVMQKEKRIKKAEQALESKRPALVDIDARIAHSARKLANAEKLAGQVESDAERQESKLAGLRRDLEAVQKAAEAAQEAQRKASATNLSLSEESLEQYRRLKAHASVLAVDERQSLETLSREEKTASRTLAQLKDKHEQLTQRKAQLSDDHQTQSERKIVLEEKVEALEGELATVKRDLENQQSQRTRISQLEKELNEKLQDVYGKMLQAGVDQRETEREQKFKETLETLQRIFPGVRGRVIDLCRPTQRKYEVAVATVLGRNIDAVVVDEERTAIDCIEYLRNQRAGQATFIPLDTIQVAPIPDKFRSFAKGARLAVDVVQCEPAVERAIHHACGSALVCDTMDVARYVCYEKAQEVKAVTLEGTVIHKSGLITGGRSSRDSSKKWDEKDVQGLQKYRDNLHGQLNDLKKSRSNLKGDEGLISEISRIESTLTVSRDDLNACELKLKGIKEELNHVKKELKTTTPALNKAQSDHNALTERVQVLADVINEAEDEVFSAFCQEIGVDNIREYEERQLKVAQQESEARLRFDTQIARLTHQSNFETEQLAATKERLATLKQTSDAERTTAAQLQRRREETEEDIREAESALEELRSELAALGEEQEERNSEVDVARKAATKAGKALDTAEKEIALMNSDIEKLALERSAIYRKCRMENIQLPLTAGTLRSVPMEEKLLDGIAMEVDEDERASQQPKKVDDYGIEVDFAALDEDEQEDGSADMGAKLDDHIAKLSADIEKMAPNLKAVDRLEDVQSKLVDMEKETKQARDDSKGARDTFNDVRKRRCDLFNEAYTHISEEIDKVYKELTKGKGVAYLSLEDSEEPYLAGVKYHATPPSKRFREMDQLSGGEKTVAALALLFAIHSFRPAPFFVLDEVDAALDNANVARVAGFVRKRAEEGVQFVVISLKGSLYERGHALVGVYRDQEVNSSRSLTLDLTQYDE